MTEYYCDHEEGPEVFHADRLRARQWHRCDECGGPINPGDRYEDVAGKWNGKFQTCKTCADCLRVREALQARKEIA